MKENTSGMSNNCQKSYWSHSLLWKAYCQARISKLFSGKAVSPHNVMAPVVTREVLIERLKALAVSNGVDFDGSPYLVACAQV